AEPEVKGLGIAAGARRPGAKKAPAAAPTEAKAEAPAEATADAKTEAPAEAPAKPEPEVKGLGIAAGARRPGAKKAPTAPAAKPAAPQPEPEADGESTP